MNIRYLLEKLTLAQKITCLVLLPLAGLYYFSTVTKGNYLEAVKEVSAVVSFNKSATLAGEVTNAIQIEKDMAISGLQIKTEGLDKAYAEFVDYANEVSKNTPEIGELLKKIDGLKQSVQVSRDGIYNGLAYNDLSSGVSKFISEYGEINNGSHYLAHIEADYNLMMIELWALVITTIILAWMVTRWIKSTNHSVSEKLTAVANGVTNIATEYSGNAETAQLYDSLESLRKFSIESKRMRSMVDYVALPIMLCDKDYNIIYVNNASKTGLKKIENLLPIKADQIIGANIDIFHKNPSKQRGVLPSIKQGDSHNAKFQIGNEWLDLNASMLLDDDGKFDGAFVSWSIVTEAVKNEENVKLAQESINRLVIAANDGDLEQRIDAGQFYGFYKELASSMNSLMDSIVKPIKATIETLDGFSKGDLTQQMLGDFKGSFSQMQTSLNQTINRLCQMVDQIQQTAEVVNNSAAEISLGSTDLSARTEQQASSLEQTAASMEELTGAVRQNTENANQANIISEESRDAASKGGEAVKETITAMKSIEASSKKIADIISVIDEIAFQTNLLALNAAVEAARAGDAGKGFAVVASEVRSLAGRSAAASKEIKDLIKESSIQVQNGSTLANRSGETLEVMLQSITKVAESVAQIAEASNQQAVGIDEINTAVSKMDEMTQQNAALVEENTATAGGMLEQAKKLQNLMKFFRVNTTHKSSFAIEETNIANDEPAVVVKKEFKAKLAPKVKVRSAPETNFKKVATKGKNISYEDGWEEF